MRFRVTVKGKPDQMLIASILYDIQVDDMEYSDRLGYTFATIEASYRAVQSWFLEPPLHPPFPDGTLLYYTELEK